MEASESDRIKFSNPDDFLIQNLFPGIHRRNRIASQNEVFVTRLVRYVVGRPGRLGSPSVSLGVPRCSCMGDQSAPRHGAESELAQALEFTMAAMPRCRQCQP